MPFLSLYSERKILAGLGFTSDLNELDCYTVNMLVNIEAEIRKQEAEERKKASKGRGRRGK
jgi:hypothetical protein